MVSSSWRAKERKWDEEDAVAAIFPDWEGGGMEVPRQGAVRRKNTVSRRFHPYLTERQRTVLKGRPRMAKGWQRMQQIMTETGMTMEEFVQTLSPEELVRGEFKDKDGHFRGRPPKWVPSAFHRACINELMLRGKRQWQENYLDAINAMTEIAKGVGAGVMATPGERLKAAQFVIERLEGKVPEKLQVTSDQPWMVVLDGIVAEVDDTQVQRGNKALAAAQSAREEILDAEVVDEEEYDTAPDPQPVRSRRRRRQ